MTLENAEIFIETLSVGVCLFCANLLLIRQRDPAVYMPLALLFLIQGISALVSLFAVTSSEVGQIDTLTRVAFLFAVPTVASPFLFWLYVRGLTSENEMKSIPKLRYHMIPIVITALLVSSVVFLPSELNEADLTEDHPALERIGLIILAILLGDVVFKIMVGTYLFHIIRRLKTYHRRLKDVFASTENRELTWIWVIAFSGVVYWLFSIGLSISIWLGLSNEAQASKAGSFFENLALLALFWIIGIWGLRQCPGLIRSPVVDPPEPEGPKGQKYEKSALDNERAARIARKIESAMSQDLLYREPNLCLWDLAKHIAVTSHYVSQTLNMQLNSSFFDYVNRWRIKDAVEQLTSTDETILVICYDVGFNSRSAFYKAFKRETGKTPSDLRK